MTDRKEPDWSNLTREHAMQIATLLKEAYALGKAHGSDWLPIADAPRDGTEVLLCDELDNMWADAYETNRNISIGWPHSATHFMPLPPPPEPKP